MKYQGRIHQCAQFLVDNRAQRPVSYGTPTTYPTRSRSPQRRPDRTGPQAREAGSRARNSTSPSPVGRSPASRSISVKKNRDGPATGDNSNSQYAALGSGRATTRASSSRARWSSGRGPTGSTRRRRARRARSPPARARACRADGATTRRGGQGLRLDDRGRGRRRLHLRLHPRQGIPTDPPS